MPALFEQLLTLPANPNIAYLLFVLGLLGVVGELAAPGAILPGLTGAIALLLALVGFGRLPTDWVGAALIVLALGLYLGDLKLRGHGLSLAGVIVFALGSLLLFTPFWVTLPTTGAVRLNLWLVAWTTVGVAAFFLAGAAAAWRSRNAPLGVGRELIVGKIGTVRQALVPGGIVHVEGEEWSAVVRDGTRIPEGALVRVVGVEGLILSVEPLGADEAALIYQR